MWNGVAALATLDQTVASIRSDAVRLDRQLAATSSTLAAAEHQRVSVLHQIAKVRLNALERGELDAVLTQADKKAQVLMQQRERKVI